MSVRTIRSRSIDCPRKRALDLPEVLGVGVDVLRVDDVHSELLLELLERRPLLRLFVDVHVVRPVREAERGRELLRRSFRHRSRHRTRPEPGNRDECGAERGAADQLLQVSRGFTVPPLRDVDDEGRFGVEADRDWIARRRKSAARVLDVHREAARGSVDDVLRRHPDVGALEHLARERVDLASDPDLLRPDADGDPARASLQGVRGAHVPRCRRRGGSCPRRTPGPGAGWTRRGSSPRSRFWAARRARWAAQAARPGLGS